MSTDGPLARKVKAQLDAEARLTKMSYARLTTLSGRDMEKLCDALGIETRGWDEQLLIRLQEHKKHLATRTLR